MQMLPNAQDYTRLHLWPHTDRESQSSDDVDDLNAQVKIIQVLLKDGWIETTWGLERGRWRKE